MRLLHDRKSIGIMISFRITIVRGEERAGEGEERSGQTWLSQFSGRQLTLNIALAQ